MKIEDYYLELEDYESLLELIDSINIHSIKSKDDVYKTIDSFLEIHRKINIFDKYYNISAKLSKKENDKIEWIIKIYGNYEEKYEEFTLYVINKFNINTFNNVKYKFYIKRLYDIGKHIPNDRTLYFKMYKESEKIFNNYSPNDKLDEQLSMMLNYVSIKEEMAKLKGFTSCLEEKLYEIGLNIDIFDKLIHQDLTKLNIPKDMRLNHKYNIKEALKLIKNIFSKYFDVSCFEKISKNIILTDDNGSVLSSYKKMPYIFLNYDDKKTSIPKLAHELGHSIHYITAMNNDIVDYNPSQFISEMFAIFCQLIIELDNDFMENKISDNFLEDYNNFYVDTTVTLRFEKYIHENYKNIKTVSDLKKIDEDFESHIKFIFNDFYDINYLCGFLIAFYLLNNNISKEKIEFILEANGNKKPIDILNDIGIDLNNKEFINTVIDLINKYIYSLLKYKKSKYRI